jgi:hypothetical protein
LLVRALHCNEDGNVDTSERLLRAGQCFRIDEPENGVCLAFLDAEWLAELPLGSWVRVGTKKSARGRREWRAFFVAAWNDCPSLQDVAWVFGRPIRALLLKANRLRRAGACLKIMTDEFYGKWPSEN